MWRGLRYQGDTAAGRARPHRETEAMTPKHRMEQSPVRKRTAKVGTHSTSVSVEEEFWQGLKEIARQRELPVSTLLTDMIGSASTPTYHRQSGFMCWTTIAGWQSWA